MRKEYPDPEEILTRHIQQSAERYADGLQRSGLPMNEKIIQALAERALQDASEEYQHEVEEAWNHNLKSIISDYRQRDHQIRREGRQWTLWICLPTTLLFAVLAWIDFTRQDLMVGAVALACAIIFCVLLILGLLTDR